MRKTMSTGHEINGSDPLNQMIDSVTHLTLLLGSLFCSSKHKSQAHLSDTSVCTLHDAADLTEMFSLNIIRNPLALYWHLKLY